MKKITNIAFLLALLPMIGKLAGFALGIPASDSQSYFILLHMLLLLIGVFVALRYQPTDSSFLEDIKQGMKAVGAYSIANAIFLFFFYKTIDIAYFPNRIASMVARTNDLPPGKTIEDIAATYEQFFTAFNWSTLSLLAWMLSGLLYTVLFTVLHRKVLRKFK